MYTVYTVYTVYTMYYRNTCIMSTKIEACCTLRRPFDIVVDTLFNRGCHPIQPLQNVRFYKYGHNSGPRGAPDTFLSAFDVNFHEKKDEIPPRARRPSKSAQTKT